MMNRSPARWSALSRHFWFLVGASRFGQFSAIQISPLFLDRFTKRVPLFRRPGSPAVYFSARLRVVIGCRRNRLREPAHLRKINARESRMKTMLAARMHEIGGPL